ncbi:MAG TPA: serine hydrolase [Herpetosiphonaceae bacterium]
MQPDLSALETIMQEAVPQICPATQLVVYWHGATLYERAYGWLDPTTRRQPTQPDTLFDLASVTKLFVVTAFLRLVEAGATALDQPLAGALPAFRGARPIQPYEDPQQSGALISLEPAALEVDVGRITFRQVLTHTAGLPAWRPLFRAPTPAAARRMALATACACRPGTQIVYSDIGLILLGLAIERLAGDALDRVVARQVTQPLNLRHTCYRPMRAMDRPTPAVAPTEICRWRSRRIQGEVHDENAAGLGGVAGHAGLFSTAADVARFGQMLLDGGAPLLSAATVAEMTRLQATDGPTHRGLGVALWSPDPAASSHPLSRRAFGHTGFTGTSLWIDPQRSLVVVLLTNEVYHGRMGRGIGALRMAVHRAIVQAIDRAATL